MPQPIMATGTITGTGADQYVEVGFKPRYVKIFNVTDLGTLEYMDKFTDDYGWKTVDSGAGTTDQSYITSNGITPYAGGGAAATGELVVALTVGTNIVVTAGSNVMTGTGTKFTDDLVVGDEIIVNSERHTVASITSDTVATTKKAFVSGATATSASRISPRKGGFALGADTDINGDGDSLFYIAIP